MIEKIFERRAEEVDDQDVVESFLTEIIDIRDTRAANKNFISSVLVSQLWGIALSRLEFDGDTAIVQEVQSLENYTERPFTDLLPNSVVHTHDVGRRGRHC
jgi:hypothetical protein